MLCLCRRHFPHYPVKQLALLVLLLPVAANFAWAETLAAGFDTEQPTVLITGSNRGIGLAFAQHYAAAGWNVIATARKPESAQELRAWRKATRA